MDLLLVDPIQLDINYYGLPISEKKQFKLLHFILNILLIDNIFNNFNEGKFVI